MIGPKNSPCPFGVSRVNRSGCLRSSSLGSCDGCCGKRTRYQQSRFAKPNRTDVTCGRALRRSTGSMVGSPNAGGRWHRTGSPPWGEGSQGKRRPKGRNATPVLMTTALIRGQLPGVGHRVRSGLWRRLGSAVQDRQGVRLTSANAGVSRPMPPTQALTTVQDKKQRVPTQNGKPLWGKLGASDCTGQT